MQKLQGRLLLLFGFAILIAVGLAVTGARNVTESYRNSERAQASQQRLLMLESLVGTLFEAESSQRAYAASGGEYFLEEHRHQREQIADLLQTLESMVFLGDANRRHADRLGELITQRMAIMDELMAVRRAQGAEAAAQLIASQQGRRLSDSIRQVSDTIHDAERAVLAELDSAAEAHNRRFLYLLSGGTLFNILLLSGAFLVIRSEIKLNARLVEQMHLTNEEVSRINRLSSDLQSCETRDEAAGVLQHFMRLLFPGASGGLYLMRPSRNLLELSGEWGERTGQLADPIKPQECWGLRSGRIQISSPEGEEILCAHLEPGEDTRICIPLMAQSEIVGMLHLQLTDSDAIDPTLKRVEILVTHLSAAIAGILLREALHQQSIRDPVTNLYNRRYMEESLERELVRANRNQGQVTIIMLDIDHFKQFNDTYGHQAGDRLLTEFAQYLRTHVRGEDIPCRYGGEEFLLVLPGANLEQSLARAETLRSNLSSLKVEYQGQQLPTVTASLGVAVYPQHTTDWEALIHLADAALYHAKHNGRNRVSSAEDINLAPAKLQPSEPE